MQNPNQNGPGMTPGGPTQQPQPPQQAQPEPPGDDTGGPEPANDEAESADNGAMQQASPEEQQQYDRFVGRAMQIIYDKQMFPTIIEMLRGGGNDGQGKDQTGASGPAQGLAHATAMIVTRVYKAAADASANLSPDVIFHGGTEIFGQLAEISDRAGISDYANDRDALEAAYFLAVDTVTKQLKQAGVIDEAQAEESVKQLQGMDSNGALEGIFQELNAKDQAGNGAQEQPPANDNSQSMQGGMAPKGAQ